jgi:hypothetical protein
LKYLDWQPQPVRQLRARFFGKERTVMTKVSNGESWGTQTVL